MTTGAYSSDGINLKI